MSCWVSTLRAETRRAEEEAEVGHGRTWVLRWSEPVPGSALMVLVRGARRVRRRCGTGRAGIVSGRSLKVEGTGQGWELDR